MTEVDPDSQASLQFLVMLEQEIIVCGDRLQFWVPEFDALECHGDFKLGKHQDAFQVCDPELAIDYNKDPSLPAPAGFNEVCLHIACS